MNNIKIGDVVAYKGDGFISQTIVNVTNSSYSHVAIYVGSEVLVEGDGYSGQVKYKPISDYKNHLVIYTLDSLTDEQRQKIVKYMESKVGLKYDRLLLLWLFIKYKLHIKLPYRNDTKVVCSEICNDAYKSIGKEYELSKKRFPIPDDILKKLKFVGSY